MARRRGSTLSWGLAQDKFPGGDGAKDWLISRLEYLKTSRPTAVNLFNDCDRSRFCPTATSTRLAPMRRLHCSLHSVVFSEFSLI